ncbi:MULTISPECIES: lactonase family protein [Burkholderia]|uniref:6-phosphogluconolactonase n=2 Tax=Burkholderia cepacia TaxID=292 RepID=A0ABM6NX99_BURCE|nr:MULTISPECIES: beta-propeller fold lactonase family protein [Burkholderia cepacia complex]AIO22496.1 lactonase, 7-bladed beta-propeller family protein [Burkholderia cepacia ATCC 25416]ALK23749.1 6-phosphogluconolactonase [Burkholderia cepacia ATCC 25416]ASE92112.1 6-phosphogluconolactonase [Burkholderia cepacia]ATF79563.1 6-phosphogluconolactonase [Burkholderia cepacia]MCA7896695.1 beta-propeller fold lactonase family protein [Burkholderia cepacia]
MKTTMKLRRVALALSGLAASFAVHAATYAYVSNADSQDISVFRLDARAGTLAAVETVPVNGTVMPMALSPDHRRLYAGLRSKPYSVVSFAINPLDGDLVELGRAPLAESMAYLSTDMTGRYLISASYGGNLLAVNRIGANGVAANVQQTVKTGPMAHAIRVSADNRYAFASVLGADAWLRLKFDASTGTLTEDAQPAYSLPKDSGPRHFVFSADHRFVYLIDELDGKLHVLAFNRANDTIRPVQTISILPPDFKGDKPWGADLHLTPDSRFLFISERTSSTLGAYRVNTATGKLVRIGTYATEKQPRGFNIDPSGRYLLAVGQLSPTLSLYRIDAKTGGLATLGQYPVGKGANWVELVNFDGSNR